MITNSTKTYIHYGSKHFCCDDFTPVTNRASFSKPKGGLWASPIDANYPWREWCENEDFHVENLAISFKFRLKEGAKVLSLRSVYDADGMPRLKDNPYYSFVRNEEIYLDFERLRDDFGIDAVELEDVNALYYELYAWDCDSIVVLNPDVIEEVME